MKNISIRNIRNKVADALICNKKAQEDDSELIKHIWYCELIEEGYTEQIAMDIAKILTDKKTLSNPESITRTRRLLQEKFPEIYGINSAYRRGNQKMIKEEVSQ